MSFLPGNFRYNRVHALVTFSESLPPSTATICLPVRVPGGSFWEILTCRMESVVASRQMDEGPHTDWIQMLEVDVDVRCRTDIRSRIDKVVHWIKGMGVLL